LNIIAFEGFPPVDFGMTDLTTALSDKYQQIETLKLCYSICTVPVVSVTQPERDHQKQKLATPTPIELLAKEVEARKATHIFYFVNMNWYSLISIILFTTGQHIISTNKILNIIYNKISLL
jgi:hypothetical protein